MGRSEAELTTRIQADFDRIALLSGDAWDHNTQYNSYLLGHTPSHLARALDIGCGTGEFSRLLAQRSDYVLALDLSPQMIEVAKQKSEGYPNIDYQVGDVMVWGLPAEQFDCVASIATLHHLPMRSMLARMKGALKEGGSLLVLDLYRQEGLGDALSNILAVPLTAVLGILRNGRLMAPVEVRKAWAEHGDNDSYLTLSEVRRVCVDMLPGATVRRHLLWRYSIVWTKC
jgi:2-polyprenyl-3-methyl-5-hydroxy-6-metoxy-1,4-benzoquinol methylase